MAQIHAQGAIADRDLVSQLSRKSFASRTVAEQKLIVQQHRPMPKLQLKTRGRVFQEEWYQRKDWLCGSEGMKGLSVSHVYYLGRVYVIAKSMRRPVLIWGHIKCGKRSM